MTLYWFSYTLIPARFHRLEGASGNVSEHHTSRSSWLFSWTGLSCGKIKVLEQIFKAWIIETFCYIANYISCSYHVMSKMKTWRYEMWPQPFNRCKIWRCHKLQLITGNYTSPWVYGTNSVLVWHADIIEYLSCEFLLWRLLVWHVDIIECLSCNANYMTCRYCRVFIMWV